MEARKLTSNMEGDVRIPSGCAIAAVISKEGKRMSGESIIDAMRPMHDRSNGLGGGFAAYGIYPEYKDLYAFCCGMILRKRNTKISASPDIQGLPISFLYSVCNDYDRCA